MIKLLESVYMKINSFGKFVTFLVVAACLFLYMEIKQNDFNIDRNYSKKGN